MNKRLVKMAMQLVAAFLLCQHAAAEVQPQSLELPLPKLTQAEIDHYCSNHPIPLRNETWFIEPSIGYMYFKAPSWTFGTTAQGQGSPNAYSFNTSTSGWQPGLAIGMHFPNANFLPGLFGENPGITFAGNYFSATTTSSANPSNVFLWGVDGTGPLTPVSEPFNTQNTNFTGKNRLATATVLYGGAQQLNSLRNIALVRSTSIGFIYNYLDQNNNLNTEMLSPNVPPIPFQINEEATTNYYGITFNNKISFYTTNNFAPFLKADIAILYAKTNFAANEQLYLADVGTGLPNNLKTTTNSNNSIAYEANLAGGIDWNMPNFPMDLSLTGGVYYLSYVPEIINAGPTNLDEFDRPTSTTAASHVQGIDSVSPYLSLAAKLPF